MNLAEHIAAHAVVELGEGRMQCMCLWESTDAPSWDAANRAHAAHVAAAWAEHRTITTAEEREALPPRTVLRSARGYLFNTNTPTITLPATVLWHPKEDQ